MTRPAHSRDEALALLTKQGQALVGDLILASEVEATVSQAMRSLDTTGSAHLGGLTVKLTRKAQDALQAARIRAMNPAQFAAYSRGL